MYTAVPDFLGQYPASLPVLSHVDMLHRPLAEDRVLLAVASPF